MTFIPIFQVEIPDQYATVMSGNYDTDRPTRRAIVCLTAVMNDGTPFGENLALSSDERLAQVLDIFIKGGVSLVCVEAMEDTRGRPDAMGTKVHERLRRGDVRVVGVDDLGLESAMTSVWYEAQMSVARYGKLFTTVLHAIEERASRLPSPALATFLRVRQQHESKGVKYGAVANDLFELEKMTGCYLPADIKRPMIAIRREAEVDIDAANAEQLELIVRLKQNAGEGVLDPERVTTFRKKLEAGVAPSESERTVLEYTRPTPAREYSPLPLAPHEAAALAYFRLRLGIDEGTAFGFVGGGLELEAYQSTHSKEDDVRESCDMAQMLGVGLNAYPNFCKFIESRQMLKSLSSAGIYKMIGEVFTKAFAHFEAQAFSAQDEKEVLSSLTRWGLLKKLCLLQLPPEEYELLVELVDVAFLTAILEWTASGGVAVASETFADARRFDERRDFFISFYDNARRRASGMALGTLEQMDKHDLDKALLISLGFHVPTIKTTLTSEQTPFWILYPITRGSDSAKAIS